MAGDTDRQDDVVRRREFTMFLRIAAGMVGVVGAVAGFVFWQLLEVNRTVGEGDDRLRDVIERRMDAQEEIIGRIEELEDDLARTITDLNQNLEEVKGDTERALQDLRIIRGALQDPSGQRLQSLPEAPE